MKTTHRVIVIRKVPEYARSQNLVTREDVTQISKRDNNKIALHNTRFAGDDRAQNGDAAKQEVDVRDGQGKDVGALGYWGESGCGGGGELE